MSSQYDRPRWCRDEAVDEYKQSLERDDELFPMLKTLKILRAIVVNVGVFAVVIYGMYVGGDPTMLGAFGLLTVGAYNGLEYSDYMALVQAMYEIKTESTDNE